MSDLHTIREERIKKLENLQSLGIGCFPAKISLEGTRIKSDEAKIILENTPVHQVPKLLAGRIMTIRGQGKILFVDLQDEAGKFQIVLKKDVLGEEKIKLFFDNIDAGDFAAFVGNLFITQRGEKSLEATDWQILTKTILPIPSSFYGLENEEERLRKRYLDILLNPELKDRFYRKAKFWKTVRNFLEERGFVEVETPTIETTTGGAEARPFKTYHNDYDLDVFMRIDIGELWQKRLLAAGFEKTYQIGKAYRNEGSSPNHVQEFTNCEFYSAYEDYKDGMKFIKELYLDIANKVYGRTKFVVGQYEFDLADEWQEIDYVAEIISKTGINVLTASEQEMQLKLDELGVKYDGSGRERLSDTLWKYCRKQIAGPAFLVNHPTFTSALSKHNLGDGTAQRFQPIIAGAEAGNGFSELNDPRIQRENFEVQKKLIEAGDEEAMMPDFSFVEMLEHGMPPAFGYGFGERLFAFFEGVPIRETQMFPLIKPKEELKVNKKDKEGKK